MTNGAAQTLLGTLHHTDTHQGENVVAKRLAPGHDVDVSKRQRQRRQQQQRQQDKVGCWWGLHLHEVKMRSRRNDTKKRLSLRDSA